MASIFSKIITGEIPNHTLAENDRFLAFLDINPLKKGHALVIPKKETDYIFDLGDGELQDLFLFAKKVAQGMKKVIDCKRIGVAVIGLEVPHAHVHLVPLDKVADIDFSRPKIKVADSEMKELAARISKEISLD